MFVNKIRLVLMGILALTACQGASDSQDVPPDTISVERREAEQPAQSAGVPVGNSQVTRGIPQPYVDLGVCPFECCTYGEWVAREQISVYQTERDTTETTFTLASGEQFQGVTGNVYIDPVGIAVTSDTVTYGPSNDRQRLAPGDTVYVLTHLGEGVYHVWHDGEVKEVYAFWLESGLEPGGIKGALLREPETEWWAQVRNEQGQTGWILMDAIRGKVGGVDACGGR